MGIVSTFGTYSLARLGIYSAQNSITVTGNNIANVNTRGYSRQAPNQISMNSGGADRYQSPYSMKIGNGSLVKNVMQLRDQYLDLRYRDAQADVGSIDASLAIQQQLAAILDEVGNGPDESGVLEAYFSAMEEQLQNMITQGTGDDRYETLFRSAANTLVTQLRSYASQLRDLEDKTAEEFQVDVDKVNVILRNIRDLNVEIRKSQIFGSDPLELLDQRNMLLDDLSYYIDFRVSIEHEDIGNDEYVDRLVIRTVPNDGGEEQILVYGTYGTQLSIKNEDEYEGTYALALSKLKNNLGAVYDWGAETETTELNLDSGILADAVGKKLISAERGDYKLEYRKDEQKYFISWTGRDGGTYDKELSLDQLQEAIEEISPITVTENGKTTVYDYSVTPGADGEPLTITTTASTKSAAYTFGDAELYGALQSEREMLTERGGFWLELGGEDATAADEYLKADSNGDVKRGIPYYRKMLDLFAKSFAEKMNEANKASGGGVLFSNSGNGDDPDGIDAMNIAVSQSWANGSVYVVYGTPDGNGEMDSTDSSNLLRILGILQSEDHEFTVFNPNKKNEDGTFGADERIFKGSFQQLFTNHTVGNLATDIATNNTRLDNYGAVLEEVYTERDGVMGVYLDDEAMDMMKYQQAYNAACRLMTTFDEMIDKLVNGM